MTLYNTAGCKLFIGGAMEDPGVDLVEADFTTQTWNEIKNLESIGTLGDTSTVSTFNALDRERTIKMKGTRDAGQMTVVCGVDTTDAGQNAIIAAEKTNHNYAFKLVLNDAPSTGASPKPSERKFIALVSSQAETYDGANDVRKMNVNLEVNSNVVRKAASAT